MRVSAENPPQAVQLETTSLVATATGELCFIRALNLGRTKKIWRTAEMVKYIPNPTDVLDALVQVEEARRNLNRVQRGLMSIAKSCSTSSLALSSLVRAASSAEAATAECYHLLLYMEGQGGEASREPET